MIYKFDKFIKENTAAVTAGNTGGMGNVVSAQPGIIPGSTQSSTEGSGDISNTTLGTYSKGNVIKSLKKKKKLKKKKSSNEYNKSYDNMYVTKFADYNYTHKNFEGFGWNYPPGAASDQSAPYNQDDSFYENISEKIYTLIINNGDMSEKDAKLYTTDNIDWSDFTELVDKISTYFFDEDSFEKEIGKEIRKNYNYKEIKNKIIEKQYQEIAKKVYNKLKEFGFPKHFADKI